MKNNSIKIILTLILSVGVFSCSIPTTQNTPIMSKESYEKRIAEVKDLSLSGVDDEALKKLGYTAKELRDAFSYSLEKFLTLNYNLHELKDAGFKEEDFSNLKEFNLFNDKKFVNSFFSNKSVNKLKNEGYEAGELKQAGYSLKELKEGGYSLRELLLSAYRLRELKSVGFTKSDLKNVRQFYFTSLFSYNYNTSLNDIFEDNVLDTVFDKNLNEIKKEFFKPDSLYRWGYSIKELRQIGYSREELRRYLGISYTEEKNDFTIKEFINFGLDSFSLKGIGFSLKELKNAGLTSKKIKLLYINNLKPFKYVGYSIKELRENNFTLKELKDAGFSKKEFLDFGINNKIIDIMFENFFLNKDELNLKDLKDIGFTAQELKNQKYSLKEIKEAGYSIDELLSIIDSKHKLLELGFSLEELKRVDYNISLLKEFGFTLEQFKKAGYKATYLHYAGFTIKELKDSGFTFKDLLGIEIYYMRRAGYSAKEYKTEGYKAKFLRDYGEYSDKELREAGYTEEEINEL